MQIFVNGISSGLAIALLAVAFQAVYLPTRVFFIGLAGVYSSVPFLAHAVLTRGGGWCLTIILSALSSIGISVLCEWANHARLARRQASAGAHLVASLGTYIVLVQIIAMIWGNDTKTLGIGSEVATRFGGLAVTMAQWTTLCVAIPLLAGFGWILRRSDLGLRLRGMADNSAQFALYGHSVKKHRLIAFAVAGFFAAAAALVTACDTGFDPHSGLHAVLLAVVAVIIGGRGSFIGPMLGGVLLGLIRAQVVWNWSARWEEAVTFSLLALVLLLRPRGLIGRLTRLEAAS